MKPLVSVVTATWGRPRTILERAIPSVAAQTYEPIEHIIVTDGTDHDLNGVLMRQGWTFNGPRRRLVNLGRNWTGFSGDGGVGAVPRLVGSYMAAGDYICYLDDDNEFLPGHVASLAGALESSGADIVFCPWLEDGRTAGGGRPGPAVVDTSSFMHRAAALKHGSWALDGYGGDHLLAERWVAAGCSWVAVGEPTMILHPHRRGSPD